LEDKLAFPCYESIKFNLVSTKMPFQITWKSEKIIENCYSILTVINRVMKLPTLIAVLLTLSYGRCE